MQVAEKKVTFTAKRTGQMVPVRALIEVLERATEWLRSLDPDSHVDWEIIKISLGKNISLTFRNPSTNGAISRSMNELRALQTKRRETVPTHLSGEMITSTRALAELVRNNFSSFKISSPGVRAVSVTPELVRRVKSLPIPPSASRFEWTTIQGTMDQVTVDPVSLKSKFRIKNPISDAEITCSFDPSMVGLDKVKDALPHRVRVYGKARIGKDGLIASIEVKKLETLPDAAFVPVKTLPKINFTDGMDSADYVERVRSGEL